MKRIISRYLGLREKRRFRNDLPVRRAVFVYTNRTGFGDGIITFPAVVFFKQRCPDAKIVVLGSRNLIEWMNCTGIMDRGIEIPRRNLWHWLIFFLKILLERPFQAGFAFSESYSASLWLRLLKVGKRMGLASEHGSKLLDSTVPAYRESPRHYRDMAMEVVNLFCGEEKAELPAMDNFLERLLSPVPGILTGEKYFVVLPGAGWKIKRWPVSCFVEIIRRIYGRWKMRPLIIGGAAEISLGKQIERSLPGICRSIIGEYSLCDMAFILKKAVFFLGNDSGPMHFSCLMGTPAIGIFRPCDIRRTSPDGEVLLITSKLPCSSCELYATPDYCVMGEPVCLTGLEPEEVWPDMEKFLENIMEK